MNGRQDQRSGANSVSNQAGGDITINNYSGLDARTMDAVEHLVRKEMDRYGAEAMVEVKRRAEDFMSDLLQRVAEFDRARAERLADPAIQFDLMSAQEGYVRTGRGEVKESLIDLIAIRCAQTEGGLQATVTSEAIRTVPKLTSRGIAALTVLFNVRRTQNEGIGDLEGLEAWAVENIAPFLDDLPRSDSEYEYLASTEAAFLYPVDKTVESFLRTRYPGLFQGGIEQEQIPEILRSENIDGLFGANLHNSNKVQVAALNARIAEIRAVEHGVAEEAKPVYYDLLSNHLMPEHEIREVLISRCPTWARVIDIWDTYDRMRITDLTSVGMAIAHCNWTGKLGIPAPLDSWIRDD